MLAYHELLYLKEINSDYDLIYVNFEGEEFVFRSITPKEYKEIVSVIADDFEFEDAVCQLSLVYPEDYSFSDTYLAGLSSKIVSSVIEISNLNNVDNILSIYEIEKQNVNGFDEQCFTLIKAAFPEYKYDEISSWGWKKIMKYCARAEKIMKLRGHDIEMINRYNDYKEEVDEKTKNITDKDIGDGLRSQGIDPMDYFSYEFDKYIDEIEYPIIGTLDWKDENMLNAVRKQMEKSNEKRKSKKIQFI